MVRRACSSPFRDRFVTGTWGVLLLLLVACTTDATTPTPAAPTAGGATSAAVNRAGTIPPGTVAAQITAVTTALPPGTTDKIDDVFLELLNVYNMRGQVAAVEYAREQGLLNTRDEVRATLVLDSEDPGVVDNTAVNVTRLGGRVTATAGSDMEIVVPVQIIVQYAQMNNRQQFFTDLAQFQHVRDIRRTPVPSYNHPRPEPAAAAPLIAQAVRSEGIAAIGADKWQTAGITGKGVKIGIVDGSFSGYSRILRNAGQIRTRSFRDDKLVENKDLDSGAVHGTGCAEIIQSIAPDAQLILVAVDTQAGFVNAVDYLVQTERVALISSSLGWEFGPKNGTSPQAKAVDRARAAGVPVFMAAGNEADAHYEAKMTDSDRDGLHDFAGARAKNGLRFTTNGGRFRVILNWADYAPQPRVNYDLLIVDANNKVTSSARDQSKGNAPAEEVLQGTATKGTATIRVRKAHASDPDLPFDIYVVGGELEQNVATGSLSTPGDARGAFTIGAADWRTGVIEEYSSQGPTDDGRKKPDFAAPTNVSSQAYALVMRRAFNGTSAATPHAAGAVGLYLQAFPTASPDDIARFFTERARKVAGNRAGENVMGAGVIFLGDVPNGANMGAAPSRGTPGRSTATPRAGSTPIPGTARAGATATASGAMQGVFADDFRNPSSGLPTTGYQNGEYRIPVRAGYVQTAAYGERTDRPRVTYEVTARRVSGPDDAGMGLLVRQLDRDNYLTFVVLGDGTAGLLARVDGSVQLIGESKKLRAFNATGMNVLRVVADGNKFTFTVNGDMVVAFTIDDVWPDGAFGLHAIGGDDAPAEIVFTKFSASTR